MINKSENPEIHAEAERYADGKVPQALLDTATDGQRNSWQHYYDQRVEFLTKLKEKQ